MITTSILLVFFFFNDTATTEIYTLSLHDALPIFRVSAPDGEKQPTDRGTQKHRFIVVRFLPVGVPCFGVFPCGGEDRKSTRLNSSHANISYAVFCLKKKKKKILNIVMH